MYQGHEISYPFISEMNSHGVQRSYQRRFCKSGIVEAIQASHTLNSRDFLPTTLDLKKARRLASKSRSPAICIYCKRIKGKFGGIASCDCFERDEWDMQSEERLSGYSEHDLEIERPLPFGVSLIQFTGDSPWPEFRLKHQWSSITVRGFWATGFKLSSLHDLFGAIPPPLSAAMENMFLAFERRRVVKSSSETG
jgi:hypothetical protein